MSGPSSKLQLVIANFAVALYISDSVWNLNVKPAVSFLDAPVNVQERFLYFASYLLGTGYDDISHQDLPKLHDAFELVKDRHNRDAGENSKKKD